jgi:hypothetical protein
MNKITLFAGAVTLITLGAIMGDTSVKSGGLVLMWIGLSLCGKPCN